MTLSFESLTKILPSESTATPLGHPNELFSCNWCCESNLKVLNHWTVSFIDLEQLKCTNERAEYEKMFMYKA